MAHFLVDRGNRPLAGWLAAFPDGACISRDQWCGREIAGPAIVWLRLRAGETVSQVVAGLELPANVARVILADEPDAPTVLAALQVGAAGCCNAHAAPEVLRQVAVVVANDGLWIGQSLLQSIVHGTSQALAQRPASARSTEWAARLSDRERQVAELVATGESNKEIARSLAIAERTVKAHLTAIFGKLGLRDRLQLSMVVNGIPL